METGDLSHGHGDGKAIAAAGREEVERGLSKIEGKHTRTSAATDAPNGCGPHDDTGAAPVPDPNAPHASAAAPRADPIAGKARGDAPDPDTGGYTGLAGKETGTGTASAARGAVGGPGTDLRTNAQIAAPAAPPARDDRPTGNDPNVQRDTGVESVMAPGDACKQSRPSTNLPLSGETGGPRSDQRTDEQFGTHAPLAPGGRLAARPADGPNVQHDTGVLESRPAPGDTGTQARPTTNLPLSGETAGQPEEQSSSGTAAPGQMEQRSERPADAGSG